MEQYGDTLAHSAPAQPARASGGCFNGESSHFYLGSLYGPRTAWHVAGAVRVVFGRSRRTLDVLEPGAVRACGSARLRLGDPCRASLRADVADAESDGHGRRADPARQARQDRAA